MFETIRRMQDGNPDDFIITKEEDDGLFHWIKIVVLLSLFLIGGVAIIACIFSILNIHAVSFISKYGIDAF